MSNQNENRVIEALGKLDCITNELVASQAVLVDRLKLVSVPPTMVPHELGTAMQAAPQHEVPLVALIEKITALQMGILQTNVRILGDLAI